MSMPKFVSTPLSRALKVAFCAGLFTMTAIPAAQAAEGTFLIQSVDYEGYSIYYTLYLVDPEGRYVKTLWVGAPKKAYWKDMPRWWKYLGRADGKQDLDAITGASIAPGDRDVLRVHLDDDVLDKGYKIRVESTVENQDNHDADVEVELTSDKQKAKIPGTGYVRYLRYKWDK